MTTRRRSSTEAPDRNDQDSRVRGMERETGFEPATLSLGMRTGSSAAARTGWQTSEDRTIGDPNPDARSPGLAGFALAKPQ